MLTKPIKSRQVGRVNAVVFIKDTFKGGEGGSEVEEKEKKEKEWHVIETRTRERLESKVRERERKENGATSGAGG